eukprot:TCALIF_11217-PA protein Name:"Similar to RTase Probable RNA-directed DNA polymerase from transposon BS (Drosophila melanogaster)" AED:0.11 eAED:0.12 QI:0/0/0/0.33/1/1/3/0/334
MPKKTNDGKVSVWEFATHEGPVILLGQEPWTGIKYADGISGKVFGFSINKGRAYIVANNNNDLYTEARKTNMKEIVKKTLEDWRKFTENLKDTGKLVKTIKAITAEQAPPTSLIKDTQSSKESLSKLLDEHFPISISEPRCQQQECENWISSLKGTTTFINFEWLSPSMIQKVVSSFEDNKAAGPDGIKPTTLKNLPSYARQRLSHLYGACISLTFTPTYWKQAKTIFIPKEAPKDPSKPRSCRLITLTFFLFKTLERLFLWRIEDTSSPIHSISRNQIGFLKGRSTEQALSKTVDILERSILRNGCGLAVFLDIQGTFDDLKYVGITQGMLLT